ncbi:MAG: hypothetical protein AAGI48_08125 [Verrucomicrobiota bacterium]
MFQHAIVLAIIALMVSTVSAQRSINYRLTVFGAGKFGNKTYVNEPEGRTKVKAIRGFVADPVKATLREDNYLDFFEEGRRPEGEEPLKPDFTITVPSDCGPEPLILLFQDGDGFKPQFLDFKKLKVGRGDQMVFNLLPVPVAVSYSDGSGEKWGKPVIVQPTSHKRIPAPKGISVSRRVLAKNRNTGKYVIFDKGVYFRPQNGKEVMFCFLKKGESKPTLETILIHDVEGRAGARG